MALQPRRTADEWTNMSYQDKRNLTEEELMDFLEVIKADRLRRYNELVADPDSTPQDMWRLTHEDPVNEVQSIIKRTYKDEPIIHWQDLAKYTINEYPIGGEIVNLINHGRLYTLDGRLALSRGTSVMWYKHKDDRKHYVWIVLSVTYRVGDRTENWLYLASEDIFTNSFTTLAGFKNMITGGFMDEFPMYARLNLDFYNSRYWTQYSTFSILRPALPDDLIEDDEEVERAKYVKLSTDNIPASITFKNEDILKMMHHIG